MGKTRIIAETGAGQHGVAVATVAARFGLPCTVFMGATDIERQKPNVFRMRLLGATIVPVTSGSGTLKDAMNEALRDWVTNVDNTFYACVGGGSNAIGIFFAFLKDAQVRLTGVEAGGREIVRGHHAARFAGGRLGVLQGAKTWILQDDDGQIIEGHSISAGLDYPGIGPEHSYLRDAGRVEYVSVTDAEALEAFQLVTRLEGIIPALEPSHALAHVAKIAGDLPSDHLMVMNMCGRGDKDVFAVAEHLNIDLGQ